MSRICKSPWTITIKEKPFHRYSIVRFRRCLRKMMAYVTEHLWNKMYAVQAFTARGMDEESLMTYRRFQDKAVEKQQIIKTIRMMVESVIKKYPCSTIGIYGDIRSDSDIMPQADDVIQQLSSITGNSADYEEVIEREQLWDEVMKLCDEYYTFASAKAKRAEKHWQETFIKIECDYEQWGKKWKEFKEIAEVFITEEEEKEASYWFEVQQQFSNGYWHEITERENSITSLKKIIEKFPLRIRQAQIEGVETIADVNERLKGWFCTPDETMFSPFITHKIIKIGIAGAIGRGEKVDKSTKVDMIFEFSEAKKMNEYTFGLLHERIPAILERAVNVYIKHELDLTNDAVNKLINEAVWLNVVKDDGK